MQDENTLCKTWEEGFCKTNEIITHYTRTGGNKPPMVLLHGLAANGMCWKNIARSLADKFDVIMPDARGHGKSSAPGGGYTYENLTDDAIGFLLAMNLSDVILIGHSMGGLTAALAACRSPLIRAAILAEPTFLSSERQWQVWKSNVLAQHKKMLAMSLTELIADRQKAHPGRSGELNAMSATARLQTSINAFEILKPPNPAYKSVVKGIKCPCLLLYGDRGIIDAVQANELHEINSLLKIVEIQNAGHGIYFDSPKQFVDGIVQFTGCL